MIVKIEHSPLINKRYRVFMDNGKTYDFGLRGAETYIDHFDMTKRDNYLKRHMANPIENRLISNLVPSPSLFSAYLLWGKYKTLGENIRFLNELWKKKHNVSN